MRFDRNQLYCGLTLYSDTISSQMLFLVVTTGFVVVLWLTQVLVRRGMDNGSSPEE